VGPDGKGVRRVAASGDSRSLRAAGDAGTGRSLLAPLKAWAVTLSLCLVALAVSVQYLVFDRLLPRAWSALATGLLLVLGVAGFSAAVWHLLENVERRLRATYAAERWQRQQLEALAAAALDLSTELDMDRVCQKIVERSRAVTGARYGALAVLGPQGRITSFYTSGLDPEVRARLGAPPEGHGLLGLVTREQRPLRVDDIERHPAAVGFPPHHPRMRTLLAVPVRGRGEVLGNLYLCDKEDGSPFTAEEEQMLERFAAQAAVAIQTARLHRQLQQLSIVAERERIAMDLHDGVVQALFGVRLQLESAAGEQPPGSPLARTLEQAVDRLAAVMADIRHYVFDLRSQLAEDEDLVSLLRELLASLQAGPLFTTELHVQGRPRRVQPQVLWELWHLAREALTNAARHSGGSALRVSVAFFPESLLLEIADNGAGWDGRPAGPGHHGLDHMRRRAQAIGAELEIDTAPGRGTRVRVSVPAERAFPAAPTPAAQAGTQR
jgi:signal transduction histidine kinase